MLGSLNKAVKMMGSAAELARRLGIRPQAIYQWRRVPAERVLQIERLTLGRVRREELRPDLYCPADVRGKKRNGERG